MVSPHERARERAADVLASVERTLSAPRPEGALHVTDNADEGFEAWQARKEAEAAATEWSARKAPAAAPARRNSLGAMTDDQIARMLGSIVGQLRRELLSENEALAALVGDLEQRIAQLEGRSE